MWKGVVHQVPSQGEGYLSRESILIMVSHDDAETQATELWLCNC